MPGFWRLSVLRVLFRISGLWVRPRIFSRGFTRMAADKKDWIFVGMVPPPDFSGAWAGRRECV